MMRFFASKLAPVPLSNYESRAFMVAARNLTLSSRVRYAYDPPFSMGRRPVYCFREPGPASLLMCSRNTAQKLQNGIGIQQPYELRSAAVSLTEK